MCNYQKNANKATFVQKETRVKPLKYQGQGTQLCIPFRAPEILREVNNLMEAVCSRENLNKAYKNVLKNEGAAGVDGMTIEELLPYLKENGPGIKEQLLDGSYQFHPVKEVAIPKPGGKGTRKLGIPTVVDRVVSQAILQVLQKHFDPRFNRQSYGFRPNKSAHQAILQAQAYVKQGYRYVVDIDLENFFGQVNHDKLMSEVAKTIQDKRLLRLLRQLLTSGILANGLAKPSDRGMPQGNPLSPLLSNILLDLPDKELEKRGHKFCRFADDCNIYVRSRRAGNRVMASLTRFLDRRLKLKINVAKSAVDRPWNRKFLGFSFTRWDHRRKISLSAIKRFKDRIREITTRTRGRSLRMIIEELRNYLNGWLGYFGFTETRSLFKELDSWIRRRLRCYIWKQWGRRGYKELRKRGVDTKLAWNTAKSAHGPWRLSRSPALTIALGFQYFTDLGLPHLYKKTLW